MSQFHSALTADRDSKLENIKRVFADVAIEAHVLGSVARGETDSYSDLDVWLTFKTEDFPSILEKRIELFNHIGGVLRIIEPHQNAPIEGLFSSVLYKTENRLLIVDYYLCPQHTAFKTNESKKLFGAFESLPVGELALNPQKAKVVITDEYRVDFCSGFIFGAIKRLARKKEEPLEGIFREYDKLKNNYNIPLKALENPEHTFSQLFIIAENMREVATEKQKEVITEVEHFMKLVEDNLE